MTEGKRTEAVRPLLEIRAMIDDHGRRLAELNRRVAQMDTEMSRRLAEIMRPRKAVTERSR